MHSKLFSATTIGVQAHLVTVESDLGFGMVRFDVVGLPDIAIKESRYRVLTALKNSGFRMPEKKITVNLAPADLKKEGTLFDLPIAICILLASKHIEIAPEFLHETIFIGELSLDGSIKFIKGALAVAYDAKKLEKKRIILPKKNAPEAALIDGIEVIGVDSLVELVAYIRGETIIEPTHNAFGTMMGQIAHDATLDFANVKGQLQAKRALQICAAGRHNILFIGSPGSGKTMLARRLPSIMPPMSFDEVLETSKIYSITGKLSQKPLILERPFRSPHHTISQAGLVGGGSFPQPGEISLAHNGILFLDELTEFKRGTLEVLRQPLESNNVCIARAQQSVTFPASFLLVAALNPCPCGYYGDKKRACHCSSTSINKYLEKLSGPLLDRIDLQIYVQSIEYETIKTTVPATNSHTLFDPIKKALFRQSDRFGDPLMRNALMPSELIDQHCVLTPQAEEIIKKAFEKLNLSMRGYHKILKIARTIADLDDIDQIDAPQIQEAIMYRSLDQVLEKTR